VRKYDREGHMAESNKWREVGDEYTMDTLLMGG
jgi:hypothetical protein